MDKNKLEMYKKYLEQIQSEISDEDIKNMSKEDLKEYMTLVAKIKARLELMENI